MKTSVHQALRQYFGFEAFREGQEEVIDALLQGQSVAAIFPTGSGKSLCFQLPALLLPGTTLVVSPLMALMKDQVDVLKQRNIAAERLDSSLSADEYRDVLKRARRGELKLLYVAPERFNNERFRESLRHFAVGLMAVDEAHCVSEWGHNFRPDYLKLAKYAKLSGAERILALTATATPKVLTDISSRFDLDLSVRTQFFRPNLHLGASLVAHSKQKFQNLHNTLSQGPKGAKIVYVSLQKNAEQLAFQLASQGWEARPYHAGLDAEVRAETQEWFQASESGIVVATIAFGMGIDKSNIRGVYHYDPPKSLENYSQEIGRAGRDGVVSQCHFFYHQPDRIPLENFVYGDTPTEESILSFLQALFSGESELILNLHSLSREHDIKLLVLKTLLTYLELDGSLQALTPVYQTYKFKPHAASKDILPNYQAEEQKFLIGVLSRANKKTVWFQIDIENTAKELNCRRSRVVESLENLALDGWLDLQATDLRFRYQVLSTPADIRALAKDMYERAQERERAEIGRLHQVLALPSQEECLAQTLSSYFGEELAQGCGHCSHCLGLTTQVPPLEEADFSIPQVPEKLDEPRTAARFLCGIRSPLLSKLRLGKHKSFGSLSHISFSRVMERLKAHK